MLRGILLALLLIIPAMAAKMAVPPDAQVAVIKKVLSFDNTLTGTAGLDLPVVHSGDEKTAKAMNSTFKGAGFNPRIVAGADLGASLGEAKVVYFCPDATDLATDLPPGVLTMTGEPSAVTANKVAIGIDNVGGKPKLLISLAAYNSCGHDIKSQVLGLAKITR